MQNNSANHSGAAGLRVWQVVFAAVLAVAAVVAAESTAEACGGFFCNQQQPVRQSFERILFTDNGDGTVTAVIQIQYQGPSEEFAWLLPVPGTPEVEVSSTRAMQRLQNATAPQYQLDNEVKGTCESRLAANSGGPFGGSVASSDEGSAEREGERDVEVVDSGRVGPYQHETISVSKEADDPAEKALQWLEDNGYDLSDIGPELIRKYLQDDMNLLAFKLSKQADAGEIRPVDITYEWPRAMIPIRLTAVAAQQDMGVAVWLAGPHRGVPTKYKMLEINQAAINWFRWRANYDQVVTQAAEEAGGQGFVTEFAGDSSIVEGSIFTDRNRADWSYYSHPPNWAGNEGELLFQVINSYGSWDGLNQALREGLELPEGVSAQDVANSPSSHYDREAEDIQGLEPETFIGAVEANVIEPVRGVEEHVLDRDYLTRLYTTMSPEDMEIDPVFDFNPDLPDVDRTRTAERTIYCGSQDHTRFNAPWKATLPDGTVVEGSGRTWPFNATSGNDDDSMPATRVIREPSMSGEGAVVQDNSSEIDSAVSEQNDSVELQSNGCSSTGRGGGPAGAVVVLLAALAFVGRRRR